MREADSALLLVCCVVVRRPSISVNTSKPSSASAAWTRPRITHLSRAFAIASYYKGRSVSGDFNFKSSSPALTRALFVRSQVVSRIRRPTKVLSHSGRVKSEKDCNSHTKYTYQDRSDSRFGSNTRT